LPTSHCPICIVHFASALLVAHHPLPTTIPLRPQRIWCVFFGPILR
jgi:hypothetical protein